MNKPINLFTIGFTKKTAQEFFDILMKSGVKRVIDTRLNNVSQLAGFTKKSDLQYFLHQIGKIDYIHRQDFAPTQDILDKYKKKGKDWQTYEQEFLQLIQQRQIEEKISPDILDGACLLCSEATPHHCHRRLVAEYLLNQWGNIKISHL